MTGNLNEIVDTPEFSHQITSVEIWRPQFFAATRQREEDATVGRLFAA